MENNERKTRRLELVEQHPCFSTSAHRKCGRMHIPCSPACNIQCRFCKRDFNKTDVRPGVARGLVAPENAVSLVRRALIICPEITVVGIAGPGDTLCTDHALRTFELLHEAFPQLINCLSTNGLSLPGKGERLMKAAVKTITVTVNAVDPDIQKQIISHIVYEKRLLSGREAAEILIRNQLAGIRELSELGAIVKVNVVLIPGINDFHVSEIARTAADAGAHLLNVIPLLPSAEFENRSAPTSEQLEAAYAAAEPYIDVFRHCKRCRADAVGIPGVSDISAQLYDREMETFSHG